MAIRPSHETEDRRGVIRLQDGRSIPGIRPGYAGNRGAESLNLLLARQHGCPATETIQEYHLRDDLARQVDGLTEVNLPLGFADVATDWAVFEVEPRRSWRKGARQVLAYAAQCGLPPALALFRAIPKVEMLSIWTELRAVDLNGLTAQSIDLWWWSGQAWEQITDPAVCRDMPDGAVFGTCAYCGQRTAWIDANPTCYGYDPSRGIHEIHCCRGLCPVEHESVTACVYWALKRASATRRTVQS
jgi:hypothetical protein